MLLPGAVFGQRGLNTNDSKGRKAGYWKIYLDSRLTPTDSANAYFWAYQFYEDGKKTFDAFPPGNKHNRYVFADSLPPKGNPVALDGTAEIWQKEILLNSNIYEKGFPMVYTEYGFGGETWHVMDFTQKFEQQEGTFLVTDYYSSVFVSDKNKKTTHYWYRKEGRKWRAVEVKD